MKKFFDKTLIKFSIIGIFNTIFGAALTLFLYNVCHLNYWLASAADYVLGGLLSFFLNKRFTFENKDSIRKTFIPFAINIITCYFIAFGISKPLIKFLFHNHSITLQENIAMISGMAIFICLNYCGQRFFVFNKHD